MRAYETDLHGRPRTLRGHRHARRPIGGSAYAGCLVPITVVGVNLTQRRATLRANGFNNGASLGRAHAAAAGPARLDDARLFHGDLRQRVAQILGVVEAYAGDDRHEGPAYVG